MTIERARELVALQAQLAGGYNRNSVKLILGEVQRHHGQPAVDALITEFELTAIFGIEPGSDLSHFGR
jgi:hypothetical protein